VGGMEALDAMQERARSVIESTLQHGTGVDVCWQCWFCVIWVSLGGGIEGRCGCVECDGVLCWGCV
jgi:hypothetical protein